MRLIPSLDLMGRAAWCGCGNGDPQQATFYTWTPRTGCGSLAEAGARRIHLVDLDGAFGASPAGPVHGFPSKFPEIHFQVGGGLRDRSAIEEVLDLRLRRGGGHPGRGAALSPQGPGRPPCHRRPRPQGGPHRHPWLDRPPAPLPPRRSSRP